MVKKKKEKPKHDFTKRQLSKWQRETRRQRIIFGVGIFIIVAVLGVTGAGWYVKQFKPLHQTVITVNDAEFDMNYYVKMLKLYGEGQPDYYMYYLAGEVVRYIEQNELIRQGAEGLDITVSNDEVNEELKSYDPPLSKDYSDIIRPGLLLDKLKEEYFEQQVPESAEQRHIMAMFLESESQAQEIRTRVENGEGDFAELAEALSLDDYSRDKKGDLDWRPRDTLAMLLNPSIEIDEYAFSTGVGEISQPIPDEGKTKSVGYWLIEALDRKEESGEVNARAILLGSEQEAKDIRARLEASENFADLAEKFSQHTPSKGEGGDLGWLTPDMVNPAAGEFIFNSDLELETLSEPIRDVDAVTKGGYWLLKILTSEDRRIEGENRELLKTRAWDEWVAVLWDEAEIDDSYLDDEKIAWAIEKAVGG